MTRYIPRPSVASDVTNATVLSMSSSVRGSTMRMAAPISGMKTAPDSTQWSNPFIPLLSEGDQGGADDDERTEQEGGVVLASARLGGAQAGAGLLRRHAGAVH